MEGRSQSRGDLVAQHGWLVRHVAQRLKSTLGLRYALEELEQMGMLGLLEAADRYDVSSSASFGTFAYYRIRGAILDEAMSQQGMKRSQAASIRRVRAVGDAVEGIGEQSEGASDMDFLVHAMACATTAVDVLEAVSADFEESEELSGYTATPEQVVSQSMTKEHVRRLMFLLPEDERELLKSCYFSLLSLSEYAERVGRSRSWACRVHARALVRLRELLAAGPEGGGV